MKKTVIILSALLCTAVAVYAAEEDMWTIKDDKSFYYSVTSSADYTVKQIFTPMSYTKNDRYEDFKVTAIESVPFGFLYAFAYIYLSKAIKDHTLQPNIGSLEDNKSTYMWVIGVFAAVNVGVNLFTFYDYNPKEDKNEKKQANP